MDMLQIVVVLPKEQLDLAIQIGDMPIKLVKGSSHELEYDRILRELGYCALMAYRNNGGERV